MAAAAAPVASGIMGQSVDRSELSVAARAGGGGAGAGAAGAAGGAGGWAGDLRDGHGAEAGGQDRRQGRRDPARPPGQGPPSP